MVECMQYSSLTVEAAEDELGVHSAFDDLNGNAVLYFAVSADGFVDGTHPAASDFFNETKALHLRDFRHACLLQNCAGHIPCRQIERRLLQEILVSFIG